jgi:hypothetical protein
MSSFKYFVEYCDSNGWQNANWSDDGMPALFKSREEAWDEINNVCLMTGESMLNYRVSQVPN